MKNVRTIFSDPSDANADGTVKRNTGDRVSILQRAGRLLVCFVAFYATSLSVTAASQASSGYAPPIPAIPDELTHNCPPFAPLQASNSDGFVPCTVNAQAGVPFHGWIATVRVCGANRIANIGAQEPFSTTGPLAKYGYPNVQSRDFELYFLPDGSWDDREHLGGDHLWKDAGQYSIAGPARVSCQRNTQSLFSFPTMNFSATVYEPVAPSSIVALPGKKAAPGYLYTQFGRVTLIDKAPPSGTMIELTTDKPNVVDVQTNFATTGHQGADSRSEYLSTYAYVPPGKDTVEFNLLVAAGAGLGEVAVVSAKCVGNYQTINQCNKINTDPRILQVTVAP